MGRLDHGSYKSSDGCIQGRVVKLDRGLPLVMLFDGREVRCKHAVSLMKGQEARAVIGDNVLVRIDVDADNAQIVAIMERKNQLVRKDPAQRTQVQVMAANFDSVLVAHPLGELNMRRLERELVLAYETGACVGVVLTKSDLVDDEQAQQAISQVRAMVSPDMPVLSVSEHDANSIESVRRFIPKGEVCVLMGRSGVGKSSLVNLLAGKQVAQTTPVREGDGKGRHTTVSRTMVDVQGGGQVVDMPGLRGLGLWESSSGIKAAFPDITQLSEQCRFRDCCHKDEPGCAVLKAVCEGKLDAVRLDSYCRLVQENKEQQHASEEAQRVRSRTGHPRHKS